MNFRYASDTGHHAARGEPPLRSEADIRENDAREKKDRPAAISPKPNRSFDQAGAWLFDLDMARDSIDTATLACSIDAMA